MANRQDIPVGRENAISREELAAKWHVKDRLARHMVARLRAEAGNDGYVWSEIPHFYYVYYVYQYASSVCYASSIAEGILTGEADAAEDYLTFLKLDDSDSPQALLAAAGINPLPEDTYRVAMDYFRGLVDEYERLVDAKLSAEGADEAEEDADAA